MRKSQCFLLAKLQNCESGLSNFSSPASGSLHTVDYATWTHFSLVKEKGNNIFYCRVTWNLINVFYVWWSSKGRCQTSQSTWHLYFLSQSPSQLSVLIIIKSHNNLCLFCLLLLVDSWQELQKKWFHFLRLYSSCGSPKENLTKRWTLLHPSHFFPYFTASEKCVAVCCLVPGWQDLLRNYFIHYQYIFRTGCFYTAKE